MGNDFLLKREECKYFRNGKNLNNLFHRTLLILIISEELHETVERHMELIEREVSRSRFKLQQSQNYIY